MQSHYLVRHALSQMRRPKQFLKLSGVIHARPLCTSKGDDNEERRDKFSWMDEAVVSMEVREASGLVQLDEDNWREFEEKGFITESESVLEKLKQMEAETTPGTGTLVSEDFVKGMLEFESGDLLEILEMQSESEGGPEDARQSLLQSIGESEMNDSGVRSMPTAEPGAEGMALEEGEATVLAELENYVEFKDWTKNRRADASNGSRGLQALLEFDSPSWEDGSHSAQLALANLPVHSKKPGYEKRVMRMESEMSGVVERTLALQYPEWDSSGAGILQVALSPNMRDLTVFYDVADKILTDKRWGKMLKRITKGVRAEIAKLDIRYAPRVHFQCGPSSDSRRDEKLDDIFAQIARDREIGGEGRSG